MSKTIHGIVHGRIIELDRDLGVAEGQEVEVQVKIVPTATTWGDGLKRCGGGLVNEWTDNDDQILTSIYQDRKRDDRKEIPE